MVRSGVITLSPVKEPPPSLSGSVVELAVMSHSDNLARVGRDGGHLDA